MARFSDAIEAALIATTRLLATASAGAKRARSVVIIPLMALHFNTHPHTRA